MDINQFLSSLFSELSKLDFVDEIDFYTEVFVVKGRVTLKKDRFLQVYYNEITGTTAFALIKNDKRIWGIDFDNIRSWHIHPVEDPDGHYDTNQKSIKDIVSLLKEAWSILA